MSRTKTYTLVKGVEHFNIKQLDRLQKRLDVAYATGFINTRLGNDLYRVIEQARRNENVVLFPKQGGGAKLRPQHLHHRTTSR